MRGYFAIGVYRPKTAVNIGTLWRHAFLYNAAFIFTIGHRYNKQCSDTCQAHRHIPLFQFADWDAFISARAYDCPLVAVELAENSTPLPQFEHPQRAIYLLGAEDNGLPNEVLEKVQHIVTIPCPLPYSMNVATAGTIVMVDRYIKQETRQ